jgi:hypothetical protein
MSAILSENACTRVAILKFCEHFYGEVLYFFFYFIKYCQVLVFPE